MNQTHCGLLFGAFTSIFLGGCKAYNVDGRAIAPLLVAPTKASHTLYFLEHPDFHKQLFGVHDFDLDLGQPFDETKLKVMSVSIDTVDLVYVPKSSAPRDKPDDLELVDVQRWQVQPKDGKPHVTVPGFCVDQPPPGQDKETCCDEVRVWASDAHPEAFSKAQAAFATGHIRIRVHPSQDNSFQVLKIVVGIGIEP